MKKLSAEAAKRASGQTPEQEKSRVMNSYIHRLRSIPSTLIGINTDWEIVKEQLSRRGWTEQEIIGFQVRIMELKNKAQSVVAALDAHKKEG